MDAESKRAENMKKQNLENAKKLQEQIKQAQISQKVGIIDVKKSEKLTIGIEIDLYTDLKPDDNELSPQII